MFFLNSVSSSIRSKQFLLALNATEYGIFFTMFGGCGDFGLRYSCESVGFEYIYIYINENRKMRGEQKIYQKLSMKPTQKRQNCICDC